jgi:DNA-binding XRE family transcriptional regulator
MLADAGTLFAPSTVAANRAAALSRLKAMPEKRELTQRKLAHDLGISQN